MAYVAHQSAMTTPSKDGSLVRDSYIAKANKVRRRFGKHSTQYIEAMRLVDGPPRPRALAYLLDWSDELFGRSGEGQTGFHRQKHSEIESWARNTGRRPQPHEIRALIRIDNMKLRPPSDK